MIHKKYIGAILKAAGILSVAILILRYPSQIAESNVNSINVCINSIIPSMFAFMVISTYIQTSGIYTVLFRPALFIMRKLIKADDSMLSVFLLSLFGGYPIGVTLLSEMIAQNKNSPAINNTASTAASFCYCISPTFALIMLGQGVLGSTSAGAIIYISNILSCLTMGVIVSRISALDTGMSITNQQSSITDSINSATRSLLVICTVIIAFNTLLTCADCFLSEFGITIPTLLMGVFEISNLLKIDSVSVNLIPLISAIASTGGICVLLQCMAIAGKSFQLGKFLIFRIPCSVMSAIYARIILCFTDISVEASSVSANYSYSFSANKIIVPVLIAMCIIIFYKTNKNTKKV